MEKLNAKEICEKNNIDPGKFGIDLDDPEELNGVNEFLNHYNKKLKNLEACSVLEKLETLMTTVKCLIKVNKILSKKEFDEFYKKVGDTLIEIIGSLFYDKVLHYVLLNSIKQCHSSEDLIDHLKLVFELFPKDLLSFIITIEYNKMTKKEKKDAQNALNKMEENN